MVTGVFTLTPKIAITEEQLKVIAGRLEDLKGLTGKVCEGRIEALRQKANANGWRLKQCYMPEAFRLSHRFAGSADSFHV